MPVSDYRDQAFIVVGTRDYTNKRGYPAPLYELTGAV
jgi:hypothetical protein